MGDECGICLPAFIYGYIVGARGADDDGKRIALRAKRGAASQTRHVHVVPSILTSIANGFRVGC